MSSGLLEGWWKKFGVSPGGSPYDIGRLGEIAAEEISSRLASQEEARMARLAESWRGSHHALESSLAGLGQVIFSKIAHEAGQASLDSPLVKVFRMVAQAAGIDPDLSPALQGENDLDNLLSGIEVNSRKVLLRDDWWSRDNGPLIARLDDGSPIALIGAKRGGYELVEPEGKCTRVDEGMAASIGKEAVMLYARLPDLSLSARDVWRFSSGGIGRDAKRLVFMGIASASLGMMVPVATGMLIESVIPRAAYFQHIQIVAALLAAAFGAFGFEVVKGFSMLRIEGRIDADLQAALFDRLLRLPVGFFRRFTAGDLGDRTLSIQTIRETLSVTVSSAVLASIFSMASLIVMLWYSWQLSLMGLIIVLAVLAGSAWLGKKQLIEEREQTRHRGRVEGLVLQFIVGVTKLKAAAAESRAFAAWSDAYGAQKIRFSRAQRAANFQEMVQACTPLLASILLFSGMVWLMKHAATDIQLQSLATSPSAVPDPDTVQNPLTPGDMLAFNAAFGQFLQAMVGMTLALTQSLGAIPRFERLSPILRELPESGRNRKAPGVLKGEIEFADVSFRYQKEGPPLLDRVSLKVEPGQFVAIVGPSGSGKSTLMRLMMGFELPERGEIFFDGKPLAGLDLTALRRSIGVVLQSGRISAGSIFSNIAGSTRISQIDAMNAARLVGLDADIDVMPMGLHTVLQEGGATLSGGQRQRLLLARALARNPGILLLDEATSALDNRTQETVMESLGRLDITRVVIAHRLSTIARADQVIVVADGKIVETGRYEELIAANGAFAALAKRQLL